MAQITSLISELKKFIDHLIDFNDQRVIIPKIWKTPSPDLRKCRWSGHTYHSSILLGEEAQFSNFTL